MYGIMGKVALINLENQQVSYIELKETDIRKFLGGSGLAAKMLLDDFPLDLDPLDPRSPIIFMNGLLTGLSIPTAAKSGFIAKSPLTGIWNESTVGGRFGMQVKRCGLDGFILVGQSKSPVYLVLTDDHILFKEASHLKGKDVYETTEKMLEETGIKGEVACIGPAGENLNHIAGIMIGGKETRAAGRGGLGAVLGSKKLKGILAKGTQIPKIKDKEMLTALVREANPTIKEYTKMMHDFGTAGGVQGVEANGDLPIKNWTLGSFEEGAQKICGQNMAHLGITVSHHACFACGIRCGKDAKVSVGPYAGSIGHGPEYETCASLGSNLLNDDVEYLVAANDICNRMGLDTICAGNALAMAMECFEKGIITIEDTGGIDLKWGNGKGILEFLMLMAERKGFAKIFSDGVDAAAKHLGGIAHEFAISVKGMSVALHDPRAFTSMAIGYATSNRGGCHLENLTYFVESGAYKGHLFGFNKTVEKHNDENKAELAVKMQDLMNVVNA